MGAVGFISRIMPFIYPVTLIKVDELTGEPIRDPRTGLVIRCRPNEDGELVGRIVDNHPVREFQGYLTNLECPFLGSCLHVHFIVDTLTLLPRIRRLLTMCFEKETWHLELETC